MQIANTSDRYGLVSQLLHWVMAGLMLAMLGTGLYMTGMENGVLRDYVYMMHKTTGLSILVIAIFRFIWIRHSPRPSLDEAIQGWQRKIARWVHKILFFMIFAVPISGMGMNYFRGAVLEFIVPLNTASEPIVPLMYFFGAFHKFLFPVLLGFLVALHVGGLLKHVLWDKDSNALRRMLGTPKDTQHRKEEM